MATRNLFSKSVISVTLSTNTDGMVNGPEPANRNRRPSRWAVINARARSCEPTSRGDQLPAELGAHELWPPKHACIVGCSAPGHHPSRTPSPSTYGPYPGQRGALRHRCGTTKIKRAIKYDCMVCVLHLVANHAGCMVVGLLARPQQLPLTNCAYDQTYCNKPPSAQHVRFLCLNHNCNSVACMHLEDTTGNQCLTSKVSSNRTMFWCPTLCSMDTSHSKLCFSFAFNILTLISFTATVLAVDMCLPLHTTAKLPRPSIDPST